MSSIETRRFVRFLPERAGHPVALLPGESYAQAVSRYQQYKFTYTNGLTKALRSLGVEAQDYYYNSNALCTQWLSECAPNLLPYRDRLFWFAALDYLKRAEPDVLFLQHLPDERVLPRGWITEAKRYCRLIVIHFGFPLHPQQIDEIDVLLMASPGFKSIYADLPARFKGVFYHYVDHEEAQLVSGAERDIGIAFAGSSGFGRPNHKIRLNLLRSLLGEGLLDVAWLDERSDLTAALPDRAVFAHIGNSLSTLPDAAILSFANQVVLAAREQPDSFLARHAKVLLGTAEEKLLDRYSQQNAGLGSIFSSRTSSLLVSDLTLAERFPTRVRGSVEGRDYFQALRSVKCCINIHTERADGFAANIRLFEATGCGALLVTEDAPNIRELFSDNEVLTYRTERELKELLSVVRKWPHWCEQMAMQGREKALAAHTSLQRAKQLLELLASLN
jgi:hypothetical protein